MKKIFLAFAIGVLLTAGVFAIEEGQIVTQSQLDSIDASTINLECRIDMPFMWFFWEHDLNWYGIAGTSCLSIRPYDEGTYLIFRQDNILYFKAIDYIRCGLATGWSACGTEYNDKLNLQEQDFKWKIRGIIYNYQTRNDISVPFTPSINP